MRFWDSSALVPLLVDEETSEPLEALFQDEQSVAVWWGDWDDIEREVAERRGRIEQLTLSSAYHRRA